MSASIVIEDYLAASTQGSVDKDNSFATKVFTLSNFDDTGVLGWQWVLSDKPAGSSAAITGAATATATITPDVPGTYLIRLLTYTDAAATLFDDADEQCVGIRYAAPHDWRIPAAGETRQFSTGRGWANEVNDILDDARSGLGTGGGGVSRSYLAGTTNELVVTLGSEVLIGGFVFDGSVAFTTRTLRAYGTVISAVANVDVLLYDMGPPGTPAAGILRSTINLATLNVPLTGTKTLTVSGAPGVNADAIFNTARMYEIRAIVNASAPGDTFKASWVGLELA